ncbi:MAG: hypothetical protein K0R07_2000 [Sedimentibacter sp.]|jgi:uncharacterized membrane protein (UPF0127 family)|nr:hypothetical protein [Sedimentibacter sp.]
MKVYVKNLLLANDVKKADTFISRLVGLLDRKRLDISEGLLLMNCKSVHCFFMKFAIDAVYLSKNMTVLDIETIYPWKIGKSAFNTANVLELAEGAASILNKGDTLIFEDFN